MPMVLSRVPKRRSTIWGVFGLMLCLVLFTAFAPAAAADTTYTVKAGDNLSNIAKQFGVDTSAIIAANKISNPNVLYVGQTLVIPGASGTTTTTTTAPAATTDAAAYVVQPGDTLSAIADKYGVSVFDLAAANNISVVNYIYVGQTLRIPGKKAAASATPTNAPATAAPTSTPQGNTYTVQPGDSLSSIAAKTGVSVETLIAVNSIAEPNYLYVGQILTLSGTAKPVPTKAPPTAIPTGGAGNGGGSVASGRAGKWIDVNISQQRLTAYEGSTAVFTSLASTGVATHPTVLGTYNIQRKYLADNMSGPGYYLPNVPYTMYFYSGYAIHGTYWHHNFGTPMSHGCVNLPTEAAGWMYNWSPLGTPVYVHY